MYKVCCWGDERSEPLIGSQKSCRQKAAVFFAYRDPTVAKGASDDDKIGILKGYITRVKCLMALCIVVAICSIVGMGYLLSRTKGNNPAEFMGVLMPSMIVVCAFWCFAACYKNKIKPAKESLEELRIKKENDAQTNAGL